MRGNAVEVEGLGKRYRLGQDLPRYLTLRDSLAARLRPSASLEADPTTDIWALRDVTFSIRQGESVGVVGRNGAGKSTLLKLLARITEPTAGVARTRGRVGALLEVGTGFHPELTGRENVFLNGSILGMTRRDVAARFDDIVEFAGVERFIDTPLKRYSTGMELRLAFAVAAHVEPPILVVDEVLAVGDAEFQQRSLGKMSELGREGRTVLFVSHDLGAIQRLCPRSLWIERGVVRQDGASAEVIESYLRSGLAGTTSVAFEPEPGGPVQLESVSVTDPAGEPIDMVRRTAPFSVRVRLSTDRRLPHFDLSIYLTDPSGVQVIDEAWSDTGQSTSRGLAPGSYEAQLTLDPRLAPGDYQLGVWVGSSVDAHENFLHREVLTLRIWPEEGDPGDTADRRRVVQPVASWELASVERPIRVPDR
jgi:ABC-2 type transport system ATP-binding protein/lipopolysaccharide transport system ATP-binding protein